MDNNRTDEFLSRFLTLLNDSDVPDVQITDDSTIGDSFKTLGFDMDCGHGFEEKYGKEAFINPDALEKVIEKYIVMLRSHHEKRSESLAEYYFRTNKHLIGKTRVAEYDPRSNEMIIITEGSR